jgi:pimeloyl-ACP methyl ester carboxylesterase
VEYYDLVSWDPRGVGRSSEIICDVLQQPTAEDSAQQREQLTKAYQAQAESCLERSQDDVASFADTVSNAKDLNLLRALLGDDKLNYLGMSWGSMLGGATIAQFPNRLNRIVLDGVQSPNLSILEANQFTIEGTKRSFEQFLEKCQELAQSGKADCIFSGEYDQAIEQLGDFLASANSEPLAAKTASGKTFDGYLIFGTVYNAMFNGSEEMNISIANAFFQAQTERDPSLFQEIYDQVADKDSGETQANQRSVYNVTYCADQRITESTEKKLSEELLEEYPVIGKYFTDYNPMDINNLTMHAYSCVGLPDHSNRKLDLGNPEIPPVLLSAATGDPATAYVAGQQYAKELANSVFITFDGPGHCPFASAASDCTIKAATNFLINGIMPENGLVCQAP